MTTAAFAVHQAILDPRWRFRTVTTGFGDLFGVDGRMLAGAPVADVLGAAWAQAEPAVRRAGQGASGRAELALAVRGRVRRVHLTADPLAAGGGVALALVDPVEDAAGTAADRNLALLQHEVLNGASVFMGYLDPEGRIRGVNRLAHSVIGTTDAMLQGMPMEDAPWWRVSDAVRAKLRELLARVRQGETVRSDMPWMDREGVCRWTDFNCAPVYENGTLVGMIAAGADITARVAAEERHRLALRELDHRVRNLFGVILSVVTLAGRGTRDAPTLAREIRARVRALADAHDVSRGGDGCAVFRLDDLLDRFMAPYREKAVRSGPPVVLPDRHRTPLGLIVHELLTIAADEGALAADGGRLEVRWELRNGGGSPEELVLDWRAHPGAAARGPRDPGDFGAFVLSAATEQLAGKIERRAADNGFHTVLRFPVG